MTTPYQIIVDAYRQSNLISIGVEPTQIQETEALRYLNRIVKSVFGNEAGEDLVGFPIGRNGIDRPAGWPWFEGVPAGDWFVPKNTRAMLNLTKPETLWLHPAPNNGSRFAITDASRNLSTNPVTIVGNGNLIDGSHSIVLDEDALNAEWFYRQDLASWVRYSPLILFDPFPFPEEFDDFFILMLAFRLNPAYERQLDPQSAVVLDRAKKQLKARYSQTIRTESELALRRLSRMSADRDQWGREYTIYDPTDLFNSGWPY